MHLNHLLSMILFAMLVSLGLACMGRRTIADRVKYALWLLALFIVIGVGIAWVMYPLSR
jgi:Na+/citrate or Na+/malate symporter